MNIVDELINLPLAKREFDERVKIKSLGRPTPALNFTQRYGNKNRAFSAAFWYKTYPWLTGSCVKCALFCWSCLLFPGIEKPNKVWSTLGYSDMKNISRSLKRHGTSMEHVQAHIQVHQLGWQLVNGASDDGRKAENYAQFDENDPMDTAAHEDDPTSYQLEEVKIEIEEHELETTETAFTFVDQSSEGSFFKTEYSSTSGSVEEDPLLLKPSPSDWCGEEDPLSIKQEHVEGTTEEKNLVGSSENGSPGVIGADRSAKSDELVCTSRITLSCHDCAKTFTVTSSLKTHVLVPASEMSLSCPECSGKLARKVARDERLVSDQAAEVSAKELAPSKHLGRGPVKHGLSTSKIEKKNTTSSGIETDLSVGPGERNFTCPICQRKFARNCNLKSHLYAHMVQRRFGCSLCNVKCSTKGDLDSHSLTHKGEQHFSCSECGKTYSSKSNLKSHLLAHTAERRFSCSKCSKTYLRKSNLQSHLLVHTEVGDFSCWECETKFKTNSKLQIHILLHKGE